MTKQNLILAIDQGGQSSRVAVYTGEGAQLHCFSTPCATTHRMVDGVEYIEQNPKEILAGIKTSLAQIQQAMGDEVKNIKCGGFAAQGSSLLCWNNQTGEALSPVLSWQDIRGEHYLKSIPLNHEQAQQITGLRMSPHYGASKIRWCLDNNEKVFEAQKNNCLSIGPIVSYIFWHLLTHSLSNSLSNSTSQENSLVTAHNLGELDGLGDERESILLPTPVPSWVDPGHAQRTLLWNLHNNAWDERLLDLFQIPKDVLPQCTHHNSRFGNLLLGDHSISVTASARDQGASLFARGQPDKSACYINLGTGAFIQRVSENLSAPEGLLVSPLWLPQVHEVTEPEVQLASSPCYLSELSNSPELVALSELAINIASQPLYAWEATVNGAASALSFIQQETGMQVTPEEINQALAFKPRRECYFLNAIGGLSAPYWRTDLQSRFSGDLNAHEKIIAWIESVVFQIIINVQLMNKLGRAQKIVISGGLSNADAVCQKIADLTQVKVTRNQNADATLQGIAYMATGLNAPWASQAQDELFQPKINPSLEARFKQWQLAMNDWLK